MHMADALLSPAVGGVMWAASAAALAYCARRVRAQGDDYLVPLMGVLGAFVFAAQMINFTIPATGSSGHLGGGLLLSILLGPHAAFLVIASVLTVQALFFADGGLLALGANIFNLGVFPCFIAYPLIYRALVRPGASDRRIAVAAVIAAVVGLQLGALGVVLQTVASGISSLPFSTFLLLMLPIHLGIGVVEGLATAAVVLFIRRARPDLVDRSAPVPSIASRSLKPLIASFLVVTVLVGGALSWFASSQPDGLEWSIEKTAGSAELGVPETGVHGWLARLQERVAFLPDYALPSSAQASEQSAESRHGAPEWPAVDGGTSLAGIVGGAITLALVWLVAMLLKRRR
ncbi:MAG: energy-coupling factor ABC transporter permease [Burkholderiaceae bacterium]|jgi:cobalt/nickel transport system permease protein|nr:energy-coupling factor ABC transporter permease [Burkholderiaceae bacterium]